jgi:Holliday junction DNA helicase RuvA
MIGQLRGRLEDKRPNQVLVDVGGVGYLVQVPLSTFAALGDLHAEVTLLIHTHTSRETLSLYGFLTAREKQFFEMLISASGVGPALALRILSGISVDELLPAIRSSDLARLTRVPGVGKKTAERIVVELRDKMMAVEEQAAQPATRVGMEGDVVSALVNLGYDGRAAEKAAEEARRSGAANFEAMLRGALQALNTAKSRAAIAGD